MDKTELERLFERLLKEPDDALEASPGPAARAALFAALTRVREGASDVDGDAIAKLSAYLDGVLDAEEAEAFVALLADAPDEIYELEAAQSFLDAVSAQDFSVPPELVAAAAKNAARENAKTIVKRSRFLSSASWGRQFAWAGGLATTAAVTVIIAVAASHRNSDVVLTSAPPPRIADLEPRATSPAPAILVAPPSVEPPPTQLAKLLPPKGDAEPRRNERALAQTGTVAQPPAVIAGRLADASAAQREAVPAPAAKAPAEARIDVLQAPSGARVAAAPPPAAPAATPEQVLVTGSLIRGSAAVGVPVTNLSPQNFAQTGALASADLFRTVPGVSPQNTERYPNATPNAVKVVSAEPVSTFSVDVDTASYANVRRYLNQSVLPPVDAVRIEEMVNYFDYSYAVPRDRDAPFQPTVAVYPSPWNKDTQILHVGIKGFDLPKTQRPKANLVFLIDTSGSMNQPNKLPLLKRSFQLLVNQLRPEDRVSIVVYAGSVGTVLEPTVGSDKAKILAAIDRMQAGGSTAGGEGIRQAYELAKANFDKTGVNRILLATDGDFNVGITDPKALEDFVARERSSGVFLTVLGFGVDNYNDLMMQKLSQAGNGTAAYIDTITEARKVFVDEIGSTLFTIAKDVKIQVEFNPARIAEYRLIGYETRMLNRTDFNNDKVDAGDIGSGHTVTALYEITPVGSRAQASDPLRYGSKASGANMTSPQGEIAFLKIRYKLPNEDESKLITRPIVQRDVESDFSKLPVDIRFAAAVDGSAQLLRHDPYIKAFDYSQAIALAQGAKGDDEFGYRNEFVQLLRMAQTAASLQPLDRTRPTARQ